MRSLFNLTLSLMLLSLVGTFNPVLAQERSSTGRHKPVTTEVKTEDAETFQNEDIGSWLVEFNAGLFGGGDLFSASNTAGDTISWVPEGQGDWVSHRIRVGLETSFGGGMLVQRRMGNWYSLRAGVSYSRLDLVAQAPVGESADNFPYDRADVWLLSAGGELRLTIQTPSYPYITGDVVYLDFSPDNSEFLSQSNVGGRLGLGYHHQFDPVWAFNVEIGVSRTVLTSVYLPTPDGANPEDIQYDNESHLSLFEAKFGIRINL